jgi:CRP-like cAMP-binding protein
VDTKVDTRPSQDCKNCSLRKLSGLRPLSVPELKFVQDFKSGELACDPGMTLIAESAYSPHLYTVLDGWGFRYKTLEDGRRQILNFVVPGDMVGLQGAVLKYMDHSVEALTPMRLCVFERERFFSLFEQHADLAFDVTWIASREECILDEHLLSVGRRSALERSAYLLAFLYYRGLTSGLISKGRAHLPVTQALIADTLGLSIVHTNKTLKKLAARKLVAWKEKGCEILDADGLCAVAQWEPRSEAERPFI